MSLKELLMVQFQKCPWLLVMQILLFIMLIPLSSNRNGTWKINVKIKMIILFSKFNPKQLLLCVHGVWSFTLDFKTFFNTIGVTNAIYKNVKVVFFNKINRNKEQLTLSIWLNAFLIWTRIKYQHLIINNS